MCRSWPSILSNSPRASGEGIFTWKSEYVGQIESTSAGMALYISHVLLKRSFNRRISHTSPIGHSIFRRQITIVEQAPAYNKLKTQHPSFSIPYAPPLSQPLHTIRNSQRRNHTSAPLNHNASHQRHSLGPQRYSHILRYDVP